jgi:ADP-ribose pyrophosphatase YjhB (NUDIX family)
MKRLLLEVWRWLPFWLQRVASVFIRPRFQVAVAAIILDPQKKILLCEHTYRRKYPWGLPGGDLKYAELPSEAVQREVLEETGLGARKVQLLWATNSREYRQVVLIYHVEAAGGAFVPNAEVSRTRFFDPRALPDMLPAERNMVFGALEFLRNK